MSTHTQDLQKRPYAKLSELNPDDIVIVDDGFEGCFISWSELVVQLHYGELVLYHNSPECGACGNSHGDCPHSLEGQLQDDGNTLIGIYRKRDF